MNLMNNVMGALAKSSSKSTIYFCTYTHSEIEKRAIQHLVNDVKFKERLSGDSIRVLAIESTDDMCTDIRLIGLMYESDEEGVYKTLILEKSEYEDLTVYFEDMEEII